LAKVLMISPTVGGLSGVGQHVLSLSRRLVALGYGVSTLSTGNTFYVDFKGLRNPSFALFAALKAFGDGFDLVHAHNVPSAIPMRVASGKRVLTVHGYYAGQMALLHGGVVGKISALLEPWMLRWADVVTVVSRSAQKAYQGVGIDAVYVPNAIDSGELPSGSERLFDTQVIFVGRLSREKGLDVLIEAARAVEGAHFLIVGSGPEERRLKTYANERIHLLGRQPWERTIRLIRGSDALVLSSRVEGLPTVLLEAMAVGTPVVATEVGGVPEMIESGKEGLLVPANDVQSLVGGIISIISDKRIGPSLAINARRKVEKTYSWDAVLPRYLEIYDRLI